MLLFLKYPKKIPTKVTHPKNFKKIIDNIEFEYLFQTNSTGLRDKEINARKVDKKYRLFTIGDSFTEGVGVQYGKRFTELLEVFSDNNVEYINSGLAGTGPLDYGKPFIKYGLELNSDGLLICLYVNDLTNTPESLSADFFNPDEGYSGLKAVVFKFFPRFYTQLKLLKKST